jgi:hypothetical protein
VRALRARKSPHADPLPRARERGIGRRLLWFAALYAGSVGALGLIALALHRVVLG